MEASSKTNALTKPVILSYLEEVKDPEIPVMSVIDMAIVRDVAIKDDRIVVFITPTYSGCPAMMEIEAAIKTHLLSKGVEEVKVVTVLSPAWTTDWMSEEAKEKLRQSGIAPPEGKAADNEDPFAIITGDKKVKCPYCNSVETRLESQFGSTACKALYHCESCGTPFDHFKCH
jgi:ring-1,2-phenylacetyl-CoA epoxidase subunit PaaD